MREIAERHRFAALVVDGARARRGLREILFRAIIIAAVDVAHAAQVRRIDLVARRTVRREPGLRLLQPAIGGFEQRSLFAAARVGAHARRNLELGGGAQCSGAHRAGRILEIFEMLARRFRGSRRCFPLGQQIVFDVGAGVLDRGQPPFVVRRQKMRARVTQSVDRRAPRFLVGMCEELAAIAPRAIAQQAFVRRFARLHYRPAHDPDLARAALGALIHTAQRDAQLGRRGRTNYGVMVAMAHRRIGEFDALRAAFPR